MSEQSDRQTSDAEADEPVVDIGPEADEALDSLSDEDVAAERDRYRDLAQRQQADFENYRKRMAKQQTEAADRAQEQLVAKLLNVLDTLQLAQEHEPSGGLEQISSALRDVLDREGLEHIDQVEETFDPSAHEAVAHEAGDGPTRVSEVLRAGYRWKGRVIRPAMVKVTG